MNILFFTQSDQANAHEIYMDVVAGCEEAGHRAFHWDLSPLARQLKQQPTATGQLQAEAHAKVAAFIRAHGIHLAMTLRGHSLLTLGTQGTPEVRRTVFDQMGVPHLCFWIDSPERAHWGDGGVRHLFRTGLFSGPQSWHYINNPWTAREMMQLYGFGNVVSHEYGVNPRLFRPCPETKPEFDLVFSGGGGDRTIATPLMRQEVQKDEPDLMLLRQAEADAVLPRLLALAERFEPALQPAGRELLQRILASQVSHRERFMLERIQELAQQDAGLAKAVQALLGDPTIYGEATILVRGIELFQRAFLFCWLSRYFHCGLFGKVDYSSFGVKIQSMGYAPYAEQSQMYCRGRVGLSVMRWQDEMGLHLKPLEIMASGVACLCETRIGLEKCFEPGKEILAFRTPGEARNALEKALAQPEALAAMAAAGRARVLRDHSWATWAKDVIGTISTSVTPPPQERRPDRAALLAAAQRHLAAMQWKEAAQALAEVSEPDEAILRQLRVSLNLADLQVHRPAVYHTLLSTPDAGNYVIGPAQNGQQTIWHRPNAAAAAYAPITADPAGTLALAVASLRAPCSRGDALAVCGMGEGMLLKHLAEHPPELFKGQQQMVYLLEPEVNLVLVCLMLHDLSGPMGPIQQKRFEWLIGEKCGSALADTLAGDLYLPPPAHMVALGPNAEAAKQQLILAKERFEAAEAKAAAQIQACYGSEHVRNLIDLLGDNPPRRPRALLLTTRFTNVLDSSTRDTAHGLEQNGWETRVMIEPSERHGVTLAAIRREVLSFRPDLVLVINRLRHEYANTFPAAMPLVTWIQDHKANLTSREAGKRIGELDYVLVSVKARYVGMYSYPARQCIATAKATRIPERPQHWTRDLRDVSYVSHWSQTTAQMIAHLRGQFNNAGVPASAQELLKAACEKMAEHYEAGGCFENAQQIGRMLRSLEQEMGLSLAEKWLPLYADVLFEHLNNVLYRQQALRWAAKACQESGLRLSIYGKGWEKHPEFAGYARGVVAYGPALEEMSRRSLFNLQLEPYHCLSHQRMLDGLAAGGFYLVRSNDRNAAPQALGDFLQAHLPAEVETQDAAERLVPAEYRAELAQLIAGVEGLRAYADPVAIVRGWQQSQLLYPGGVPHLEQVSFGNQEELRQRLAFFLAHPEQAQAIAAAQREVVENRLSYSAVMARSFARIRQLLKEGLEQTPSPAWTIRAA